MNHLLEARQEDRLEIVRSDENDGKPVVPEFTASLEAIPELFQNFHEKEALDQLVGYTFLPNAQINIVRDIIIHVFKVSFSDPQIPQISEHARFLLNTLSNCPYFDYHIFMKHEYSTILIENLFIDSYTTDFFADILSMGMNNGLGSDHICTIIQKINDNRNKYTLNFLSSLIIRIKELSDDLLQACFNIALDSITDSDYMTQFICLTIICLISEHSNFYPLETEIVFRIVNHFNQIVNSEVVIMILFLLSKQECPPKFYLPKLISYLDTFKEISPRVITIFFVFMDQWDEDDVDKICDALSFCLTMNDQQTETNNIHHGYFSYESKIAAISFIVKKMRKIPYDNILFFRTILDYLEEPELLIPMVCFISIALASCPNESWRSDLTMLLIETHFASRIEELSMSHPEMDEVHQRIQPLLDSLIQLEPDDI